MSCTDRVASSVPIVASIAHVREGRYEGHLVRVRSGGAELRATPHHLVPARLVPMLGTHLVYLMWRADRGWRIGRTVGARPIGVGQLEHGLFVRTNQEHADAAWILKVCGSVAEAAYFEAWFAAEYGLPTTCFHAAGRELAMDDPWLERAVRLD